MNKYRTGSAVTQLSFWIPRRECSYLRVFGENVSRSWVPRKNINTALCCTWRRERTCSKAFKKSYRYPANDNLAKLTLLLGEKNNRHLLGMSQSHLESPSATGGGGKTCLKWQCFVCPVSPPTVTWAGLFNFTRYSSLMSAAVISPWFCVSQH